MVNPVLYVVIPVFNEEDNIIKLTRELCEFQRQISGEFDAKVIFVDDGSTDATAKTIEQQQADLHVTVLRHEINRGPGEAFGTGFEYLRDRLSDRDWVVTMEGDNTSRLDTLRQMLVRRLEGYEVVFASPYTYGGGFTQTAWHRIFMSHAANGSIKLVLGIRGINTFSSFFRLYNARVLNRLYCRYGPRIIELNGFESMIELLCKLIYQQATISEVPLMLDTSQRAGKSKMKILLTMVGYIRVTKMARNWR